VTVLCALSDIPDPGGIAVTAAGARLLLIRHGARVFAYQDRCPHMGISLLWPPRPFAVEGGRFLVCANHNAVFRAEDGVCVHGPCEGERLLPRPVEIAGDCVRLAADP